VISRDETKRRHARAARRAKIIALREVKRLTLREIAEQFGISAERVRQIVKAGK
jgi:DNA-directed RNA polymerase sigma subunit (sigma70/sigma32)